MQGFFTILIKSKFGNISWNFVFKLKVNFGDTDFNLKPNYRYPCKKFCTVWYNNLHDLDSWML